MTDAELVLDAQQGVEHAFEELVKRHEAKVFGLARRLLCNAEDARDLSQEVFIRAFRAIPRVDPDRRFESWLLTITVNTCRSHLKRRKAPIQLKDAGALAAGETKQTADPALVAMREALAGLSTKYRIALVLFHQEGKSCDEIASVLGVNSNRVRTWLHRGRRLLREALARKGISLRGAS